MKWLTGMHPLDEQVKLYCDFCRNNLRKITSFYNKCIEISNSITSEKKALFDETMLLHASIHYYCTLGVLDFEKGYKAYRENNLKEAFIRLGDSASRFCKANRLMRDSEHDVW